MPDLAIVPISSTRSSRVMPMPLSRTVKVRASLSTSSEMCRSLMSTPARLPVSDSSLSLSRASEAFEISSRRKMSLFE